MRKYLVLFSFSGEAIGRFVQNPSDRAEVVRKLTEAMGGTMECYYWMFGQYDGLVIASAPDSESMAALSLAVTGTGAFRHFETHELIESGDLIRISQGAKELQSSYQAPGATS
ncbi:MAG: GYD domain-containing protein [Chloroflexi bacterium]|nr:GYD domain-containing protein [Chloroflexota bacterium]